MISDRDVINGISSRNIKESFKYSREKCILGEKEMNGSELRIEKKEYGYRITIDGESYFIKNGDKEGWFKLVVETSNGEIVDVVEDKFENLGTRDLSDLIGKLVANPSEVLEMLLGEKKDVGSIVIKF